MSVEEVGKGIEDIFAQQVATAAGAIVTARAQVDDARRQLAALTEGSGQERVSDLHAIFAKVAGDIGTVAADIHATQEVKAQLFADWGFAPSLTVPGTAEGGHGTSGKPEAVPFSPPAALMLDLESLKDDGTNSDPDIAYRTARALKWSEIHTLRDVVLFGTDGLRRTRNMGDKRIEWITKQVTDRFPNMKVPARPDPALAAQVCGSLSEVPAHIFDPVRQLLPKLSFFTADEILHLTLDEVMQRIWNGSAPLPGSYAYGDVKKSHEILCNRAKAYAAKFHEAKQRQ